MGIYKLIGLCIMIFCSVAQAEIKAVIFDCDGILVDTEKWKFQGWKKALQSRGIDLSCEKYQSLIGMDGMSMLKQFEKDFHILLDKKILDEKNANYWELQKQEVQGIPYVLSALAWIKKSEPTLLVGVASSASKKEIFCNLRTLKIEDAFDVILSGQEDLVHYADPSGVNKPKPYIYLEAAQCLGVNPDECLVLEDSEAGLNAAKNAGCKVIALPTDWTIKQNFQNADLMLYDPNSEELIGKIQKFLEEK